MRPRKGGGVLVSVDLLCAGDSGASALGGVMFECSFPAWLRWLFRLAGGEGGPPPLIR